MGELFLDLGDSLSKTGVRVLFDTGFLYFIDALSIDLREFLTLSFLNELVCSRLLLLLLVPLLQGIRWNLLELDRFLKLFSFLRFPKFA